ncbi:MAG: TonB C-terminal domain-containing protein [Proteobacteria bacterium]|nr:TonB C-terminal domain-containing protein [Pseudomonadota bacterium]
MTIHKLWPLLLLAVTASDGADERRPCSATARSEYKAQISRAFFSNWQPERGARSLSCTVVIAQNFRGEVLNVVVEECGEEVAVHKSVENALYLSSPLPKPENRSCFERTIHVQLSRRAQE